MGIYTGHIRFRNRLLIAVVSQKVEPLEENNIQLLSDAKRKLGFLRKAGYDIFGNNKLFAPLVKWGAIEENVEEIKNAAETYEKAINDILSTMTDEENVHQVSHFNCTYIL